MGDTASRALTSSALIAGWKRRLDITRSRVANVPRTRTRGRLTRASGLILETVGLNLPMGGHCWVEQAEGGRAEAEVVGFTSERLLLMPLVETSGLVPGARVWPVLGPPGAQAGSSKQVPVGDALLGRVLDARGRVLDERGPLFEAEYASLNGPSINPLKRAPIDQVLNVGIRAINALLTVGRGQRLGLFAGSGVGKSVLLGMMARFTQADVIVVGLIGERGREVKDFIDNILGEAGLARAVVVAAPADTSPLLRLQGADYASRLAEDFRDRGRNVLLIMDSLTRYAMAQREIALAVGEPPATKGYPPSVFARLPTLVERAGNAAVGQGSITAFYTVLTEGDDTQDPIADAARAILDGHFVLSRKLAEAGHYPAIDIEASISRAMTALIDEPQFENVQYFKRMFASYERNRDLISVGAYAAGSDPTLDQAIALYPQMETFLQQAMDEHSDFETARAKLDALLRIED